MKFTETDIADYIMGRKPFPAELLELMNYNLNNHFCYFMDDTEENKLLSTYVKVVIKQAMNLSMLKIIALEGEIPVFDTITPKPLLRMASIMQKHVIKLSKLNDLSAYMLSLDLYALMSKDTHLDWNGFFSAHNLEHLSLATYDYLVAAGFAETEKSFGQGYVGDREQSQLVDVLVAYLGSTAENIKTHSEAKVDTHQLEVCLMEAIHSKASIFVLDRAEIKDALADTELTEFVWDLLYKLEPRMKSTRDTCNLLGFSDAQTKVYMRRSLVETPRDLKLVETYKDFLIQTMTDTVDLSDVSL